MLALVLAQTALLFLSAPVRAENAQGESRRITTPTSAHNVYFSPENIESLSIASHGSGPGTISVYQHLGGTLIPFGALSAHMGWPITINQDNRVAEGFSPVTGQKITIAPVIHTILVGGEAHKVSENQIFFYQNDIYLDSEIIDDHLGINLSLNRDTQTLAVDYKKIANEKPLMQSSEVVEPVAPQSNLAAVPQPEVSRHELMGEPMGLVIESAKPIPSPLPATVKKFEDESLVLQIIVNNIPMVEFINAQVLDGKVFLPFSGLTEILEFPIKSDIVKTTAQGWFVREENDFSFDGQTAVVRGKSYKINLAQIIENDEDFYFDKDLLQEWFSVQFNVNTQKLELSISSQTPFPFEERLKREQLYATLENQKNLIEKQKTYTPHLLPYKAASIPIIDVNLNSAYQKRADQRFSNNYYIQGAGDLAYMTSKFYISGDLSEHVLNDFRSSLGRDDNKRELLGPLKASSFRFGDISSIGVSQIAQTSEGRGITLTNRDIARTDKFDVTSFTGDSTPGWDVELYRNKTLIDTQRVDEDGRYEFNDVPILFGNNAFKILLLGPQGQQEEKSKTINASDSILKQGHFTYNLSADQKSERLFDFRDFEPAHPDGWRAVSGFEYGVTKGLTATAGGARTMLQDGEHKYATVGARASFLGLLTSIDNAYDFNDQSRSTRLTSFANFFGTNIRFTQKVAQNFVSEEDSDIDNPVKMETGVDMDRMFDAPLFGEFSSGLFYQKRTFEAGNAETIVRNRLTKTFRGFNFTNALEQNTSSNADKRFFGSFAARGLLGANFLGMSVDYNIQPEKELSLIKLSWLRNFTPDIANNFSISRQYGEEPIYEFENGITFDLKKYKLSLLGRYDTTDDIYLGMTLNFSLGRFPEDEWTFSSRSKSETGIAVAKTFIDDNYNLVQDDKEESAGNIPVKIGARTYSTNSDGIVVAENLELDSPTYMYADQKRFDDQSLGAGVEGYEVALRPGYPAIIPYPLFKTSEIEGYVELPENVTLPKNTKMSLVNGEGQIVAEITAEFDGYFLFRNVLPGNYVINISEDVLKNKNLDYDVGEQIIVKEADFLTTNLKLKSISSSPVNTEQGL